MTEDDLTKIQALSAVRLLRSLLSTFEGKTITDTEPFVDHLAERLSGERRDEEILINFVRDYLLRCVGTEALAKIAPLLSHDPPIVPVLLLEAGMRSISERTATLDRLVRRYVEFADAYDEAGTDLVLTEIASELTTLGTNAVATQVLTATFVVALRGVRRATADERRSEESE